MRALITGGAGFLGSHLADYLLQLGHTVTIVDNLSTGRFENIRHLEGKKGFRCQIDTVFNKPMLDSYIRDTDIIFHLASAVGVRTILTKPTSSIETILRGTSIVLFLARRYGVRTIITSSSEVYGKSAKCPFSEDDDLVIGPSSKGRWAYAASKLVDEFLAMAHYYESNLPVTCVRLFNISGPRQVGNYGMVIPRFIHCALCHDLIPVHGDGSQTRCFCHVRDAVRALVDLVACHESIGKVVNIGSDEEISVLALAKLVKEITNSPSGIQYVPYEDEYPHGFEDTVRRVPDLTLAHKLIDYAPTYAVKDIIEDIIAWRK